VKKLLIIFLSFFAVNAFATHERAGEITYKCRPDISPYAYEITITTYTKISSSPADRCSLMVFLGTGDSVLVCRNNGTTAADPEGSDCTQNPDCPGAKTGEWYAPLQDLDIKKNIYSAVYIYPGPGVYVISMTDPNRNNGIVNVPDLTPFSIQDTLIVWGAFPPGIPGCNNSAILTNMPIDFACEGICFTHNAGAYDIDGDSLSYQLAIPYERPNVPISGYFLPGGISIDPITGDFTWCVPPQVTGTLDHPNYDEYNFAFIIKEWTRNSVNGKRYLIGTVRRDMQVKVYKDCDNVTPIITTETDTCIEANSTLVFIVKASDPDSNTVQTFTATGGPFATTPSASFSSDAPAQSTATGVFTWTPSCNQVRKSPYLVTFKAVDDGAPDNIPLTDYEALFITVIAPAPENLTAQPQCVNMLLTWDAAWCNPTGNILTNYKVYRRTGCDNWVPGYCETGVPSYTGYTLMATVAYNKLNYTDNNGGTGLAHGFSYSYRVVAVYADGAESYASNPLCNKLVRDVPLITNVDVTLTGTSGSIDVKWVKPIADANNFDTTLAGNGPPYRFDLFRAPGNINPTTIIQTFSSNYFATLNTVSYTDSPINTSSTGYTYRVEFYSASNTFCQAKNASSVFLACNPGDNILTLTWNEMVPWTNSQYDIYKYNSITTNWDSIGSTSWQTFTDSGLANGSNYCYKVKSMGSYTDTTIVSPLINWSQEICCSPQDLTPPCPNIFSINSSCENSFNLLTWTNPNHSCSNDALYYIIYYSSTEDGELAALDTIQDIHTLHFLHDTLTSIAGCYAVTSVDSFGNESNFSNLICVDNCPYYELPNVFTPNGDNENDFFTPLRPYKYIKNIDIKIYNRWGTLLFQTTDPEIMWEGKDHYQTNLKCSDGVYYYVCLVNDIRLKGIIPRVLKGNVHLLSK